jgi:hypothetical protein
MSYAGASHIDKELLKVDDVWFQADTRRVYSNMTRREGNHYRATVHPLFSLTTFPTVKVLQTVLTVETVTAVRITCALVASCWIIAMFAMFRRLGCRRFDASLFCLLAVCSASAVFWFVVPETYPLGSLAMLLALYLATAAESSAPSQWHYVVVSAATLSFTITNWTAGLLVTLAGHPWRKAMQISLLALALVAGLWGVQRMIFPSSGLKLNPEREMTYAMKASPLSVVNTFVMHSMVMPVVKVIPGESLDQQVLSVQRSWPGSGSVWGMVASGAWMVLVALGIWSATSLTQYRQLRIVLGLTLAGQLGLHLFYGEETFLYSLHYGPLLVVLAALSTLTRLRVLVLSVAGVLLLSGGMNNWLQHDQVAKLLPRYIENQPGRVRLKVTQEMATRPQDPWPRGMGHVVLAVPGTSETEKGYHEPGGNFSPAPGSFGVSLWLTRDDGTPAVASETLPLDGVEQAFLGAGDQEVPVVRTTTQYYEAVWSHEKPSRWRLEMTNRSALVSQLVIRSVGPAGGPIDSLDWDGRRLLVNERWSIEIEPAPVAVYLMEEGTPAWMRQRSTTTHATFTSGWGYARVELGKPRGTQGKGFRVTIDDGHRPSQPKGTSIPVAQAVPRIDLPDPRFEASFRAQVAHLMMGLVGDQTRPGDPMHYPLPWQRDGAYVITALARGGQLEAARLLATYLAENDFFGGFGPEADAPGLALWSLEEVARRINRREYDQWLYPHVQRKVALIGKMLTTEQPMRVTPIGPIVPAYRIKADLDLVADPPRDGLINGKMDWQRPLLFVNAVSYRGLIDAATLAERLGHSSEAERWSAQALAIKQAWERTFVPPMSNNDRTYVSSLWPTGIGVSITDVLERELQKRWQERRDEQRNFRQRPLWTYFDLAEAHQWLWLGRPEKVWPTVEWFWRNQASPGLYTWWEGEGEENTFHRWEHVRGWLKPPHVTPHYWTAAEMLLLQLDMLAYVDSMPGESTVVIGAGIPTAWVAHPMSASRLSLPDGQLDWRWDGHRMEVTFHGSVHKVRMGPGFPSRTPIVVKSQPI